MKWSDGGVDLIGVDELHDPHECCLADIWHRDGLGQKNTDHHYIITHLFSLYMQITEAMLVHTATVDMLLFLLGI